MSSLHRPLRDHLGRKEAAALVLAAVVLIACGIGGGPSPSDDAGSPPPTSDDAGVDAGPTCNSDPVYGRGFGTVSGVLRSSVHDINYGGRAAYALSVHKLDVDAVEDGCVTGVGITVENACYISLGFESRPGFQDLVLMTGQLVIGSDCPGWLDHEEGDYALVVESPSADGGTVLNAGRLTPPAEVGENQAAACVGVDLQPRGEVTFRAANRSDLRVNLGDLRYQGAAWSRGDPNAVCAGP